MELGKIWIFPCSKYCSSFNFRFWQKFVPIILICFSEFYFIGFNLSTKTGTPSMWAGTHYLLLFIWSNFVQPYLFLFRGSLPVGMTLGLKPTSQHLLTGLVFATIDLVQSILSQIIYTLLFIQWNSQNLFYSFPLRYYSDSI